MKSIIKYDHLSIYILCFLLVFTSCQNNNDPEPLFSDTPAVRVKKEIEKLRTTLKSSKNGWKVTYFTDDEQLGGYSFLFNFIGDEEVVMDSDFGNPDPSRKSLYDITLGSTIKLTFTTKNVIHELSDGANYPDQELRGKGYKGDFEFLLSSYDGDDIVFRVNRNTSNYLRFKRASAEDWNNLDKATEVQNKINNLSSFWNFNVNGEEYYVTYNKTRRYATSFIGGVSFGVGFTTTGIKVSPGIESNGVTHTDFTFDLANEELVSVIDNNYKIKLLKTPFGLQKNWVTLARAPFVSESFVATFNKMYAANQAVYSRFPLSNRIEFGNTEVDGEGILFRIANFSLVHNLIFISNKEGELLVFKAGEGFNWRFVRHLNPMVDEFVNKSPYIVQERNNRLLLTSKGDPDYWLNIFNL